MSLPRRIRGATILASFVRRSVLDEHILRSSEDAFVDQLFASAPLEGAPFLTATAPRAWIDVNRSLNGIGPGPDRRRQKVGA